MIKPNKTYPVIEIPELHSFFHKYRGRGRSNLYPFVRNYLPFTVLETPKKRKKYFVRGSEIIKFLKRLDIDLE